MSNFMQDAAAWLGEQQQQTGGRECVYWRQQTHTETITGVVIDTEQQVMNEDYLATGVFIHTWQFFPAVLVIDGETIEPRSGDRIKETLNGVAVAYEVVQPGPGKPVFEWSDGFGTQFNVHTKKTKA